MSTLTAETLTLRQALAAASVGVPARRAHAMVPGPDRVLGLRVRPLTLPVWSRLEACDSPFIRGGQAREGDVRNYLWFSSRLWMRPAWWNVPTFAKWCALLPFNSLLHARKGLTWYSFALAQAITDIEGIVRDAVADAPRAGSPDAGAPGPALEAQFIDFCAGRYGWSAARTRRVPLRELFQLFRSACPPDAAAEQQSAIIAHLTRRNAELAAARAFAGVSPTRRSAGGHDGGENSGQTPAGQQAGTGHTSDPKP